MMMGEVVQSGGFWEKKNDQQSYRKRKRLVCAGRYLLKGNSTELKFRDIVGLINGAKSYVQLVTYSLQVIV